MWRNFDVILIPGPNIEDFNVNCVYFCFCCLHCNANITQEWCFNEGNLFYLQNCRVCCTNVMSWRLRWSTSFTRCSTTSHLRSGYKWLQLLLTGCKPPAEIPIIITTGAKLLIISTLTSINNSPPDISDFTSLVYVQSKLKVWLRLFQRWGADMIPLSSLNKTSQ